MLELQAMAVKRHSKQRTIEAVCYLKPIVW
jgi:hypothetical protein